MSLWEELLSEQDKATMTKAHFGKRMGIGDHPAVLCIDCQVYMVGDRDEPQEESTKRFPSSCGHDGWLALEKTAILLKAARRLGIPVFYTAFSLASDGSDAGVYALKRDLLQNPNWLLDNTPGVLISPLVAPCTSDIVIPKKKPSAFFGTPLLSYLIGRKIDTLIISGGSTSNCVRATVFDAASYNFRAIVVSDCVFDRFTISHKVSLFDMDRQFADVVALDEVLASLKDKGHREDDRL
jgi:maleamate amidohydrolase